MTTFSYPPSIQNGKLLLSNDDRADVEAILSCLSTRHGERVLRPSYGSNLDSFATVSDISGVLTEVEVSLDADLAEYQPLVTLVSGDITDDGVLTMSVQYDDTDSTRSIQINI